MGMNHHFTISNNFLGLNQIEQPSRSRKKQEQCASGRQFVRTAVAFSETNVRDTAVPPFLLVYGRSESWG